jgi:SAM-dependent methyltransferase
MWLKRRRLARTLAVRFPPPERPWTEEYLRSHAELVSWSLDSQDLIEAFADRRALPASFGLGFDERVVEYPWFVSQKPRGRVLDAGSTLNHEHVLVRVLPLTSELHEFTLAPEPESFPQLGVSYVYGDLRSLPYQDGYFDTVVSLSTLEHVGMDTSPYGVDLPHASEPQVEACRALEELLRVVAPGGTILLTLPYGRREDHGWFRQLDSSEIEELVAVSHRPAAITVYRHGGRGWVRSSLEESAGLRYHDHKAHPETPTDRAAAARAVACVRIDC